MRIAIAAGIALSIAVSLSAQTTASLAGRVTSGGTALSGVTVTIESPLLQGARSTRTGDGGVYAFDALPPGDYSVTFSMRGMRAVQKTTRLQLSGTTRVDAALFAQGTSETLTVVADVVPAVAAPPIATNLTLSEVEKLPVLRNQLATSQLPPGVTVNVLSNGELAISGGPGYRHSRRSRPRTQQQQPPPSVPRPPASDALDASRLGRRRRLHALVAPRQRRRRKRERTGGKRRSDDVLP